MKTFDDKCKTNQIQWRRPDGSALEFRKRPFRLVTARKDCPRFQCLLEIATSRVARPGSKLRHGQVIEQHWRLRGLVDRFLQGARRRGIVPTLEEHPAPGVNQCGIS